MVFNEDFRLRMVNTYSEHHRIAAAIVCIWEEIYNAALLRSKKDQWAGRVSTRKLTSVLGLLPKIPALPADLQKRIVGPQALGSVTCAGGDEIRYELTHRMLILLCVLDGFVDDSETRGQWSLSWHMSLKAFSTTSYTIPEVVGRLFHWKMSKCQIRRSLFMHAVDLFQPAAHQNPPDTLRATHLSSKQSTSSLSEPIRRRTETQSVSCRPRTSPRCTPWRFPSAQTLSASRAPPPIQSPRSSSRVQVRHHGSSWCAPARGRAESTTTSLACVSRREGAKWRPLLFLYNTAIYAARWSTG